MAQLRAPKTAALFGSTSVGPRLDFPDVPLPGIFLRFEPLSDTRFNTSECAPWPSCSDG